MKSKGWENTFGNDMYDMCWDEIGEIRWNEMEERTSWNLDWRTYIYRIYKSSANTVYRKTCKNTKQTDMVHFI